MNKLLFLLLFAVFCRPSFGQHTNFGAPLHAITDSTKWSNINRAVIYDSTVSFEARLGEGAVWLKNYAFSNGLIEVDIKGKNLQGQSFVGVAFHVSNDGTYDAIYFRPFNFFNPERKNHSIQYISMPGYTWPLLREKFPEKYESKINTPPDPDGWFHVSIGVQYPKISVYVNREKNPSFTIDQLSNQKTGSVGLWVGHMSEGKFKNLNITSF